MNLSPRAQALRLITSLLLSGAAALTHAADPKASQYYEDALTRYEKKDFAGAVIQLRNALRSDSKALPVQVLLGKALLAKGEVGPAEVAFATALSLGVNRAEVVLPMADAVIAQGKQPELLSQPRFGLNDLPPAVKQQLLIRRAKAQSDTGDHRTALQSLEQARAIDARSAEAWMEEVPVRIRTRQFPEGEAAAAKAISLAPGSADAWYHKGALAHARGNLVDAQQSYEKALNLNPAHLESRVALIGIFIDSNNLAAANTAVAELTKTAPREPRGVYLKALLAEKAGNPAASAAALRDVTALLDPVPLNFFRYRPQFLMLGGLAHYGLGEREKAKPYLLMVQRNHANNSVAKLLATINIGEKNYGEAIENLEAYLRSFPNDMQAFSLLAAAEMGAGHPARATQRLKQALAQSDALALRTQLGTSLMVMGKLQDAIQELELVFKRDPSQGSTGAALVMLYLQTHNGARAKVVAEQLVKRDGKNANYLNLLGISQATLGDTEGARRSFESAEALDPKFTDPVVNLAKLDISAGTFDKAAARLNQILKADDKNLEAMLQVASLASVKGDVAQATRWLQKAADVSAAGDLRAGLLLIDYHLSGKRLPAALEALKSLEARAPDDVRTLQTAARVRLAQGDKAAAKIVLARASGLLGSGTPNARFQEVAMMQLAADDLAGATRTVDKALAEDPGNLFAQGMQIDILVRGNALDKADSLAQKVAAANPKAAFAQAVVGDVAMARQQWTAAAAAYRKALQLEPNSHTAQRLFRALTARTETAAEAMSFGRQWLKGHSGDLGMRRQVADSLARTKDFKAARVEYEAVLKLAPKDLEATNNLVSVLVILKDPEALTLAETGLKFHPEAPTLISSAGWAAFHAGKTDRALELLRNARLRDPADPDTRYMLAKVLSSLGKNEEARGELDGALASGLAFDHLAEAHELRATLR